MKSRLALGAAVAILVSAATAAAATDGTATLKFSTKKSHAPTSLTIGATFAPGADGQQRIINTVTLVVPVGTKFTGKNVTLCPGDGKTIADDPEGAKHACPAASQVAVGSADVLLGDNETTFDITAWNQAQGPTLELSVGGKPAYTVDPKIKGNKITYDLPLAEQIQAKIKSMQIAYSGGTKKKPYLRTPSSCPKGKWTGGLNAGTSAGEKLKLKATTACKKTKQTY